MVYETLNYIAFKNLGLTPSVRSLFYTFRMSFVRVFYGTILKSSTFGRRLFGIRFIFDIMFSALHKLLSALYLTGFTDIKTFRFPNRTHQDPKNLKIYHNLINFEGTRLDVTNEMNERYTIIQKLVRLFKSQGLVRDEGWQYMYKVTDSLKFYEKDMIGSIGQKFTTKSKVVEWNQ